MKVEKALNYWVEDMNRKSVPLFIKLYYYFIQRWYCLTVRNLSIKLFMHVTRTLHYTRAGTLIVANIYLQLIQNRYMFRSFTVLQCSHQHFIQPVASDVEDAGYL